MPPARSVRNAAILGAAGLAGVDAFEAAQYRRSGAKGFDLENPPSPGTPDFASTRRCGWRSRPARPAGVPNTVGVAADAGAGETNGSRSGDPTTNSRSM